MTGIGTAVSLYGAAWLVWSSKPDDPRYNGDGMLYPGQQTSKVVPALVRDQRKVGIVIAVGNAIVLAGVFLSFLASFHHETNAVSQSKAPCAIVQHGP
ncbi:MAG: hypothetical protein WCB73_19345 [Pseudonocardiaceae bacterium]